VFRSVLVLAVLRWPHPGKQDSPELVGLRDRLGRQVVQALWRRVQADAADPGIVAGVARQVAVAVTAQAPGGPDRYSVVDRRLTAGVARAFIDQTLAAVREADEADTSLVGAVERLHQEAATTMSGFRRPNSQDGPLRVSPERLLGAFVSGIDAADPRVWAHLRDRLLGGDNRAPVPTWPGTGEPSGLAEPGLLPDDSHDWLDLADWPDLADLLESDDSQDLAGLLDLPVAQPLRGSPGEPEPSRSREPDLDQRRPDLSWLRRLVPDSPPTSAPPTSAPPTSAPATSAPATAPGQPPAGANVPEASPTPDRAGTGGIPPWMAWGGSRKRTRNEGHQPGSSDKRVARQQE
jgi:hypothetical protein